MNNKDLIFENKEEKEATEKVLALFKGKKINENIDTLVSDILRYAKEIDELLGKNDIASSYLDKVSNLSETEEITWEETIDDVKLKEEVDDLIKRINTRIKLIKDSDSELKKLTNKYDIDNVNLDEELKKANLI